MWLDRKLIKSQARNVIDGKCLRLFGVILSSAILFTMLFALLYGAFFGTVFIAFPTEDGSGYVNNYEEYFNENFGADSSDAEDDFNSFDGSGSTSAEDDFNSFDGTGGSEDTTLSPEENFNSFNGTGHITLAMDPVLAGSIIILVLCWFVIIAEYLLIPLPVSLRYYFVELVNGKYSGCRAGVRSVYRNAFKVKYGKKLGCALLVNIITGLLAYLLYIPAVIFGYSAYFAFEILCEYPELSPVDAIKLSRKMVRGNRTELFVLDLSFIPWMLLSVFVFPCIYVLPYMMTTRALYYENFKRRALALGRITQDDFLSEKQKMEKMMNGGYGGYYGPQPGAYTQSAQGPVNQQQYQPGGAQQAPNYPPQGGASAQQAHSTAYQPQQAPNYPPQGQYHQQPQSAPYPPPPQGYMNAVPYETVMKTVFFEPVIVSEPPAPVQAPPVQNTAQDPQPQPAPPVQFTETEPQEPVEPEFTEPQEQESEMTEPVEPVDPQEPEEPTDPAEPAETQAEESGISENNEPETDGQ